jgi:hypothetical protein
MADLRDRRDSASVRPVRIVDVVTCRRAAYLERMSARGDGSAISIAARLAVALRDAAHQEKCPSDGGPAKVKGRLTPK